MNPEDQVFMTDNLAAPQRVRNVFIALFAIALSVIVFFVAFGQTSPTQSLAQQAEQATPLAAALSNEKPTLVEFYANWCTSCQAMAADLATLKQDYRDRVNFVMLNVDNPKWLPEILRYNIDGIPHFVYLDKQGTMVAQAIGEQPLGILRADLRALAAGEALPYAQAVGEVSAFSASPVSAATPTDPRSHGAFAR